MSMDARYAELLECVLKPYVPGEPRCVITSSDTTWEGKRWTEVHKSGNTMTIGTMTVPLWDEFLVCTEHEPKEAQ